MPVLLSALLTPFGYLVPALKIRFDPIPLLQPLWKQSLMTVSLVVSSQMDRKRHSILFALFSIVPFPPPFTSFALSLAIYVS